MAAVPLRPPSDPPLLASEAQHSTAWADHHDKVADALTTLQANMGVTDGSDATAGQIGEYLTASGGPVALSNNVPANVASLPLQAGDWDVSGNVHFAAAATTHPTQCAASISTVSGAQGAWPTLIGTPFNTNANVNMAAGPTRVNVPTPTTVYLVGFSTFTTSTMAATGQIVARRAR